MTALHHPQFGEYGSLSIMVTIGGAESPPPSPLPRGKEDILKAVRIRVNWKSLFGIENKRIKRSNAEKIN